MNKLFADFERITKKEWIEKIKLDLKGKDLSILEINDEIEELNFSSYYHEEDAVFSGAVPGNYPFHRGMNNTDNTWKNGILIEISNESQANTKALNALNTGADLLIFKPTKSKINWKEVIKGIQFEFIESQFVVTNSTVFKSLIAVVPINTPNVHFNLDFLSPKWNLDDLGEIALYFREKQVRFCVVESFRIQGLGATTWQEIAFCLSESHEYLVNLMKLGFTIDEASACIGFKIGIGSNYFYEIAKIRVLKMLWSKIIKAYNPDHECSFNCHITAVIGHMNKSLADPYTNLLRQTTEAMSAINGGIQGLVILPFDQLSSDGSSPKAERLALNISTILKEESYIDKVIDPLGGSYSLEKLTEQIGIKAWDYFKRLDHSGGIFKKNVQESFAVDVKCKREERIEAFLSNKSVVIGINKYENPVSQEFNWKPQEDYLGMTPLILEQEYKKAII